MAFKVNDETLKLTTDCNKDFSCLSGSDENLCRINLPSDKNSYVGCADVKKIMEEIAKREFSPLSNLAEKLICERLRDLGYLDKEFKPRTESKKPKK